LASGKGKKKVVSAGTKSDYTHTPDIQTQAVHD